MCFPRLFVSTEGTRKIMNSPLTDVVIRGSGSDGNSQLIGGHLVVDVGLPWAVIGDDVMHARIILISHEHGDHMRIPVLRSLVKYRPMVVTKGVYLNRSCFRQLQRNAPEVARLIPPEHVIKAGDTFDYTYQGREYSVEVFELSHDVENCGFVITDRESGHRLIHATDTMTMKWAPAGRFDTLLVEGNYDPELTVRDIASGDVAVMNRAARNYRHLSVNAFEQFVLSRSSEVGRRHVAQLHVSFDYGRVSSLNTYPWAG